MATAQITGRQIKAGTVPASAINNDSGVTGARVDNALNTLNTSLTNHENDTTNPHNVTTSQIGAVPTSDVGTAGGVASLDAQGKVPQNQIPALALERLTVVADQTARYALTSNDVQNGDIVKQTDTAETFVVTDDTSLGGAAGFTVLTSPTSAPVDSVHGRIGAVVAQASDYDASQIDNDSAVAGAFVDDALNTLNTSLGNHTSNTSNPHSVTAAQAGAYTTTEVDNLLGDATNIGSGTVSNTELGYVNGVTSNVQTQINGLNTSVNNIKGGQISWLSRTVTGTVNGTNTGFTMSATPDASSLLVFVNNLPQTEADDYSVSGTTLTFTTAPLTGDEIMVYGIEA